MPSRTAILRARGLAAGYGGAPVVAGVALEVAAGEVVTIVGRSGSGKSTLLLTCAGLHPPLAGSVTLDGEPPVRGDDRIGLVLQHYGLLPWYTVEQNVALGLRIRHRRRDRSAEAEATERAHAAIARLGLGGMERRYPRELSGGEQQRVALARTLVLNPRLLLLDEPFSALDAIIREELQEQLLEVLRAARLAAVLVTHSIDEAVYLGDRVGILAGRPAALTVVDNPAPPSGTDRRTSPAYFDAVASLRRRFQESLRA